MVRISRRSPSRLALLALAIVGLAACESGDGGQAADPDVAVPADADGEAGGDAVGPADAAPAQDADGAVACTASCPLAACGVDDGCGGMCPPCPSDESCPECPLRVHVVERDDPFLFVAVDFAPAEGVALPTLADLRLRVEGDATLLDLEVGEAVLAADKAPFPDPQTGEPYQLYDLEEGAQMVRVTLGSVSSTTTMGAGRWLTWRFRLGGAFTPLEAPVVMGLSTDEPLLAPPAAEQQLWGSGVDGLVALWPAD